jgi:hypothetical protein
MWSCLQNNLVVEVAESLANVVFPNITDKTPSMPPEIEDEPSEAAITTLVGVDNQDEFPIEEKFNQHLEETDKKDTHTAAIPGSSSGNFSEQVEEGRAIEEKACLIAGEIREVGEATPMKKDEENIVVPFGERIEPVSALDEKDTFEDSLSEKKFVEATDAASQQELTSQRETESAADDATGTTETSGSGDTETERKMKDIVNTYTPEESGSDEFLTSGEAEKNDRIDEGDDFGSGLSIPAGERVEAEDTRSEENMKEEKDEVESLATAESPEDFVASGSAEYTSESDENRGAMNDESMEVSYDQQTEQLRNSSEKHLMNVLSDAFDKNRSPTEHQGQIPTMEVVHNSLLQSFHDNLLATINSLSQPEETPATGNPDSAPYYAATPSTMVQETAPKTNTGASYLAFQNQPAVNESMPNQDSSLVTQKGELENREEVDENEADRIAEASQPTSPSDAAYSDAVSPQQAYAEAMLKSIDQFNSSRLTDPALSEKVFHPSKII